MIFRTLVNSYNGTVYNVTYRNSKGTEEIITNSTDTRVHTLTADVYQILIGSYEHEHKFYLGGVYAVLAVPKSAANFVRYHKRVYYNRHF